MSERQYTITHPVGPVTSIPLGASMGSTLVPSSAPTNGAFSPMPPNVAAAISKVMAGVPKLERGETNKHADYKFASIDDFLEAVRPLCAESGLIILQDEQSSEMLDGTDKYGKPKRWLSVTYSFTLAHSSGETWAHRPTRSIVVDASMGSQAYGAAQSYTLKLFERSLFQIATGEKGQDVDEHAPVDLPDGNGRKSLPARKSSAAAKRDGDWETLKAALADCQSAREVERLRTEYRAQQYHAWNADWRDVADEEFEKRLAEFSGADLKQTLQDSLEDPEQARVRIRDQMIEEIQKMTTEEDLLVWKEGPEFRRDLASLPKPMQLAVRKAGATKLETLQKAAR